MCVVTTVSQSNEGNKVKCIFIEKTVQFPLTTLKYVRPFGASRDDSAGLDGVTA